MENDETELPEHVRRNRVHWDARTAEYVGPGERAWARQEPTWGIWRVPDAELRVLPEDLAGKDVIELGCGTAYISAWLVRAGHVWSGSTTLPPSWQPPAGCSVSMGLRSR